MKSLPPPLRDRQSLKSADLYLYLLSVTGDWSLDSAALSEVGRLFGFTPGRTRTALSRLVSSGKLVLHCGDYRLSESAKITNRHLQHIRWPKPKSGWHNEWILVLLPDRSLSSKERRRAYHELRLARFFAQQPGVWLRPDNLAIARKHLLQAVQHELPDITVLQSRKVQGHIPLPTVDNNCCRLTCHMRDFMATPPADSGSFLRQSFLLGGAAIAQIHYANFLPVGLQKEARHEWEMLETFRHFNRVARRRWVRWLRQ